MISGGRTSIHAAECADRAGKHAFGLNDTKAIAALRKLADDIEAGTVVLNSVTTSSHATHEEFAIREVVIEVLEDYPSVGPRMVREYLIWLHLGIIVLAAQKTACGCEASIAQSGCFSFPWRPE